MNPFNPFKSVKSVFFRALLVCTLTSSLFLTSSKEANSAAGVPKLLNFQGRLTDENDNLLSGTYYVCFSIHDAVSAGNKLWPAGDPSPTAVSVSNGVFSTQVGSADSLTLDFNDDTYYLNVYVNDTSSCTSGGENLTPRQRITAAGYAINSDTVDGLNAASFLRSDAADVFNESGADIDLRFEGDTDPNLFFLDASANALGIGTTGPQSNLDVRRGVPWTIGHNDRGNIFLSTDLTAGQGNYGAAIGFSRVGGTAATTKENASIVAVQTGITANNRQMGLAFFTTPGAGDDFVTEAVRIEHTGNIGIGTTAPGYKLEVVSATSLVGGFESAGANGTLVDIDSTTSKDSAIRLRGESNWALGVDSSIGSGGFIIGEINNFPSAAASSSKYFVIDTNGNVGIGTTGPSTKLELSGTGSGNGLTIGSRNLYDDTGQLRTDGDLDVGGGSILIDNSGVLKLSSGTLEIGDGGSSTEIEMDDNVDMAGNNIFSSSGNLDLNDQVYISGNLGIGTTAPSAKLHVRGTSNTADFVFHPYTTPAVAVGGSTGASIITSSGTGSSSFHMGFEIPSNDANDGFFVSTDADNDGTVDTVALKINAVGNVGIGTTNPGSYKINVQGDGYYLGDLTVDGGKVTGDNSEYIQIGETNNEIKLYLSTGGYALLTESSFDLSGVTLPGDDIQDGTVDDSEIQGNSLDFSEFQDTLDLDANLTWNMGAYDIDINWNSGDAFFIDGASGNVGIGTTGPSSILHLYSTTQDSPLLLTMRDGGSTGNDGDGAGIKFNKNILAGQANSAIAAIVSETTSSKNILGFRVGAWNNNDTVGTDKMVITSDGNVGIGTTAPGEKLHVYVGGNLGGTAGNYKTLTRLHAVGQSNSFFVNDFLYRESDGTDWQTASYIRGVSVDSSFLDPSTLKSWIKQYPIQNLISFGSAGSTYMTIKAGNVGIGTTAPESRLDVQAAATGQYAQRWLSSTGTSLGNFYASLSNEGRLKINNGAGSARAKLSAVSDEGSLGLTNSFNSQTVTIRADGASSFTGGGVAIGSTLGLLPGTATLHVEGQVGIGTTNPLSKLSVGGDGIANAGIYGSGSNYGIYGSGDGYGVYGVASDGIGVYGSGLTYDFYAASSSGKNYFAGNVGIAYNNPGTAKLAINGNVGIGTTGPGIKLDVVGGIRAVNPRKTSPSWINKNAWDLPDIGTSAAPAFADLDNDGDYDVVIGEEYGNGLAYENTGSASSPTWTNKDAWDLPDIGDITAPAFADLDNDGDYDVLIGDIMGDSSAYENTGSASSPTWTNKDAWDLPNLGLVSLPRPAFADLDNDGDYDVIIGVNNGDSRAYENTGSASSPTWTNKDAWDLDDVGAAASPAFADLDNDGDYDVVIGVSNGDSQAYENTGSASSPTWTNKDAWDLTDVGATARPAFADLDNDGDYDVIIGESVVGVSQAYQNGDWAPVYIDTKVIIDDTVTATDFVCTDCLEQGNIGDSAIGQGELKTATSTAGLNCTTGQNVTMTGGTYSFYPQIQMDATDQASWYLGTAFTGNSYTTNIGCFSGSAGQAGDYQNRYIQASPPYFFDGYRVKHFIWVLWDTTTGEFFGISEAEDPVWEYYEGGREAIPHPFPSYYNQPLPDNLEIAFIDPANIETWKARAKEKGMFLSEYLRKYMEVDPTDINPPLSPETGKSISLPRDNTWRRLIPRAEPLDEEPGTIVNPNGGPGNTSEGADIAENFTAAPFLEAGDVVEIAKASEVLAGDHQNDSVLVKSTAAYSPKLMGIISTDPAQVLHVGGSDGQLPLALTGRVPTKVSTLEGTIQTGDPLTSSPLPGIGMKAVKAGPIIGKALEGTEDWNESRCPAIKSPENISWPKDNGNNSAKPCFKLPDGTYIGKILTFINVSWYDPDVFLTSTGNILINDSESTYDGLLTGESAESPEIASLSAQIKDQVYTLKTQTGEVVERMANFAEVAAARMRIGLVETTNLIAGRVIVEKEIVSPVVKANELEMMDDELRIMNQGREQVASIDSEGNAEFEGEVRGESLFAPLLKTDEVRFTDNELRFTNPEGEEVASIDSEGVLEAKEVSVSGKVAAKEIEAERAEIKDTLKVRRLEVEEIYSPFGQLLDDTEDSIIPPEEVTSPDLDEKLPIPDVEATSSIEPNWRPFEDLAEATISGTLTVRGKAHFLDHTVLNDTTVTGDFSQGGTLFITDGSKIDNIAGELSLQRDSLAISEEGTVSAKKKMEIENEDLTEEELDGIEAYEATASSRLKIQDSGLKDNLSTIVKEAYSKVKRVFELKVAGKVMTYLDNTGRFFARVLAGQRIETDIVSPLSGGDLAIILEDSSLPEEESSVASTETPPSRFKILNSENAEVASIDSQGTATFTKLAISQKANDEQKDINNASIGSGVIAAGHSQVLISTTSVTIRSKVFITPTSSTDGQVPYVLTKAAGSYFIVKIDKPLDYDVGFDWWIVN